MRTVQGVLEETLTRLQSEERVKVRGAGRTDSGVHAVGQVVDFHLRWPKSEEALLRALNAMLPEDVAVRSLARALEGFHPRYDALSRAYIYTVLNSPQRQPLLRRVTLHDSRPLDVGLMDEAIRYLVGEHDFATFGRATTPSESTTRSILKARVWREDNLVRIVVEANGFLYRMVRSIVGSLLPVGRGEQPPTWMAELLAARDRSEAAPVISPQGLCLVSVRYPDSSELDHPIPR
ncbi:MAG: tRNA pseudouridine(38-40) synthase TruA [Chloroflexota bacterium]|nr:tRNA pseudouridine(38-40) synthase TruA [Chloroflexota bacterium]